MKLSTILFISMLVTSTVALEACSTPNGQTTTLNAATVSEAIAGAETTVRGAEQAITVAALNGWIKKDSPTAQTIVTVMSAANKALDLAQTYYAQGNFAAAQSQADLALSKASDAKAQTPTSAPTN